MLAALGTFAYAASMMTHEALGHGVSCLAVGGHNTMLTAWRETCDLPSMHTSAVTAAGPSVQFGAGLAAWLALHLLSPYAIRLRYFLLLYMVFNLLISSGYVAFSGVTDFGDAAEFIAGLHPHNVWRGILVLFGAAMYFLSMRVAALELRRFAGQDDESSRLLRLVWVPYAAAGLFACCTGALNRTMGRGEAIGLAAASSFGAGFGLLCLPFMQYGTPSRKLSQPGYLRWSAAWGVVAGVIILVFLFYLGPGLQ